jgi:hypothetical protein
MKKNVKLDFSTAFKYPFNRMKGLLNIFWLLLPIFGWFALGGYGIRIIKEFTAGKYKKLPVMSFEKDMKLGFFMFLKALPFVFVVMIILGGLYEVSQPWGSFVETLLAIFVFPMLGIHFANKQTVGSLFEFEILKPVFTQMGDYIITLLKEIGLMIIYVIMTIILIGLPAAMFTQNIFLANFYRRNIKK